MYILIYFSGPTVIVISDTQWSGLYRVLVIDIFKSEFSVKPLPERLLSGSYKCRY